MIFWGLSSWAMGEGTQFPYKAQIAKDGVYLRSGPGQEYYPTDTLKAGQVVEVYQHDPGGWCAIRPPEGSFSWVLSRQLEIGTDGLARAKEDRVPVVVGSRLKNLQDTVQVYLKQGEIVALVEEVGQQPAKEIWYKIAPPSGEFRWVFGQDIVPLAGDLSAAASGAQPPAGDVAPQTPAGGTNSQSLAPPAPTHISPSSNIPTTAPGPGSNVPPISSGNVPTPAPPGTVAIPPGSTGLGMEQFRQKLNEMELELAGRVVAEPSAWQLQDLASRVELLLGQAPDAASRSEARELLSRITRFMEVQRQYGQIALAGRSGTPPSRSTGPGSTPASSGGVAQSSALPTQPTSPGGQTGTPGQPGPIEPGSLAASASPVRASEEANRFDGMGRLSRVVSAKPGAPTYALVNEQGEVVCYVTPAPGINLRPFEGKWIGVSGVTGLMLEPRAKHVAVKQVAVLDSRTQVLR